ncbi:hypothetical protein PF010_g17883 [Phytophthora fragariae]|uniref:Ty3 transposon capsid-like protein domain-containing protein n=1 Tax=Phytophthora fragariae TaxID=53985 RepID=A0A6G0KM21_9STRA|nr:hypothetical protein PF010_g17883 [Phytophthora fragariae]
MAPVTRKNDNDAPAADGERQAELEAQLAQLRAEIVALQAKNLTPRPPPPESKPRVPSGLPKFKGKRDEDVRQWLFQVETLCRINGHDATDSTAPVEQTWEQFTHDALAHFEASNYQAVLRQKLRQLRQTSDIEEYNGKYSSLVFRVENMSEVDQVSYYCDGLKRATQAYVKLQNATTLSEAMDQASKYEMSHFGGERKPDREISERAQRFREPLSSNASRNKKPFNKRSYKPGHYAPMEQTKNGCVLPLRQAWALQARLQQAEVRAGKRPATPIEEGPDGESTSEEDLTVNEATLNLLCEDPLVYDRAPLFTYRFRVSPSCEQRKLVYYKP